MPNFRPFSACWGDISFTEAPHTTTRCYAGAIFLSCKPSKHPHRGRHRRNRAHLETQSLAAVLVGGGGAWPDNEPTHRAHISDQAPLVWRAPEGPEGTGGLRDRPLRAQLACGDLAGGRARRRPEHQRRRKQQAQSRIPAALPVGGGGARAGFETTHRAHISDQAPLVWRAPEGLEGTGGLRDRPLRAAGSRVAISRAAGPDGARNTSGATQRQHAAPTASGRAAAHRHTQRPGPTKQPGPTAGPDGARNTSGAASTAGNQTISGSRAPSGSPTRRQHPSARAGAPNRR